MNYFAMINFIIVIIIIVNEVCNELILLLYIRNEYEANKFDIWFLILPLWIFFEVYYITRS